MSNVFDYIKWRGELSFRNVELNDIDALILSRLSYIPFEGIVPASFHRSLSLEEAAAKFNLSDNYDKILWATDPELLSSVAKAKRFSSLRVSACHSELDYDSKMQFSAIVFQLDDGSCFVSFRGTDNTFIGWQEDFNMYSLTTLPSQQKALEYFNKAASAFDGDIVLGGHSKGGNLAIYASVFCDENVKRRIKKVYNFDGPGFNRSVLRSEEYAGMRDRIMTFVPQSSVFGMMLEHDEDFSIVHSTNKSFMQHDIYSWQLMGRDFEYLDRRTNSSNFIDHTLSSLLDKMTPNEIESFTDAFFKVLESTDNTNFKEIQNSPFSSTLSMLRSFTNLDKDTRSLVFQTIRRAIGSMKNNLSDIKLRQISQNKQKITYMF